jgi:hypothetical protein
MGDAAIAATVAIIGVSAGLLWWLGQHGGEVALRETGPYDRFRQQPSRSIEDGRDLLFAMGRGPLSDDSAPADLAALLAARALVAETCASGSHPWLAAGDGALFVAARDAANGACPTQQGRPGPGSAVQFIAPSGRPLAYAAGVTAMFSGGRTPAGVLMLGRHGLEAALIAEAADRAQGDLIAGTDDPQGMAVALPRTEHLLLGEELFVAGAHLRPTPAGRAGPVIQDFLRLIAVTAVLLSAAGRWIGLW